MKKISISLVIVTLSFVFYPVSAKVIVSTGGSSDGDPVVSEKGPKGVNKLALTSAKGGTIAIATARSLFTKKKITHGNKVVSAGTGGDEELTHVNANSSFAGTATFISDDGNPVENFTIDLGLSGTLRCKTDPDIPQFFSLAQMSTDVIVDGDLSFSGTATQDGAGPFSASGDISTGDFTTGSNTASLHKTFPINLGTLTDGQKLAFFFAGSTLVSYGADVPITFCSADFYNTDTFQAAKKQGGKLTIGAGKTVTVQFIDDVLSIESSDESLLNDISILRVIIAAGGGVFEATAGALGDVDADGISDVIVTATNQATMISALQLSSNNTVFVFGETGGGDVFSGTADISQI
jgi:hypothetical protein